VKYKSNLISWLSVKTILVVPVYFIHYCTAHFVKYKTNLERILKNMYKQFQFIGDKIYKRE